MTTHRLKIYASRNCSFGEDDGGSNCTNALVPKLDGGRAFNSAVAMYLQTITNGAAARVWRDGQKKRVYINRFLSTVTSLYRSESTSTSHTIVKGAQSAWDMLQEEETLVLITTSSLDFDNILGGGIICKEVTEIGRVPGIGKTQLGIQLAVNVQIPFDYGGLGGKTIYIAMWFLTVKLQEMKSLTENRRKREVPSGSSNLNEIPALAIKG
ncbi:hypothetical protein L2E82_25209 [Cichorium intybus]|uniref:Uncharacterized protein n=1 Tax=Cichorium intybus TaxID=13427 RepID=A0ACB9E3E3_CICIN|nr:hypothetical protein L2E82_25209 [Cichorium intybus]